MSNLNINEIINEVKSICIKYNVEHLYLFGSYATNTFSKTSDIDFVIKGDCYNIDKIIEEIDNITTLKKIDIFEYEKCKNNILLKEDIDNYAKIIY